jgi:hypothetical protein
VLYTCCETNVDFTSLDLVGYLGNGGETGGTLSVDSVDSDPKISALKGERDGWGEKDLRVWDTGVQLSHSSKGCTTTWGKYVSYYYIPALSAFAPVYHTSKKGLLKLGRINFTPLQHFSENSRKKILRESILESTLLCLYYQHTSLSSWV